MKRILVVVGLCALLVGLLAPASSAEVDPEHGWDHRALVLNDGGLVPLRGGFVGDRGTDILWYAPGTGADTLWISKTGLRGSANFGRRKVSINGRYTPIVGDFAGDWHTDILWYAPGSAADSLWVASGDADAPFTSRSLSISGTFQPKALYDASGEGDGRDGKDDILFYADGSAKDYLWHFADDGSGTHTTRALVLGRTFKILAGDWDGDLRADVLLYAPGTASDLQWLFKEDGSYTVTQGPRLDATDYQPTLISQQYFDSILLWRSGAGADAFFEGTAAGLTKRTLRQGGWRGVASNVNGGAVIVVPDGTDIYFNAPDRPDDFYDLAGPSHDLAAGTIPVSGDFDSDGGLDIAWYGPGGAKDQLWYTQVPAPADKGLAMPGGRPYRGR